MASTSHDGRRLATPVFDGEVIAITRAEIQGDGVDDLAVVKRGPSGANVPQLYNAKSAPLCEDTLCVADKALGSFHSMAFLNVLPGVKGARAWLGSSLWTMMGRERYRVMG